MSMASACLGAFKTARFFTPFVIQVGQENMKAFSTGHDAPIFFFLHYDVGDTFYLSSLQEVTKRADGEWTKRYPASLVVIFFFMLNYCFFLFLCLGLNLCTL